MSSATHAARRALQCPRSLQSARAVGHRGPDRRHVSFTAAKHDEPSTAAAPPVASGKLDPSRVVSPAQEKKLLKMGLMPIGSRRRRAALQSGLNVPFEQLPYQCFQEARQVLQADREEKLQQIALERARIAKLQRKDAATVGGAAQKQRRLRSMQNYLEQLKIYADINDPVIKKRYEDGQGDMNRPIYRFLADREWRAYRRLLLMQRLTQMKVVPDILPHIDPTAEVRLGFGRRNVQPGEFVESRVSETIARLHVQVFDKGERLVSVAVVDPDVPNVDKNGFDYRCHFLACNLPIAPTLPSLPLSRVSADTQMVLPWLPPWAQKGSPYHRLSILVLRQPEGAPLDVAALRTSVVREGFNLRSFNDKHRLVPVGATMFRSQWDEGTAEVMGRLGVEGADVEFRRPREGPLKKVVEPRKRKENRGGVPSKRL
ncbi:MAG: hypothetical protein M1838_003398 [Thelocarpon superellum]|nr:MAG: hypothetical protein M1838_003398 [Thelocarpon superellum]